MLHAKASQHLVNSHGNPPDSIFESKKGNGRKPRSKWSKGTQKLFLGVNPLAQPK